eukprot:1151588-Pelagomonas_calceolata.AAC.3
MAGTGLGQGNDSEARYQKDTPSPMLMTLRPLGVNSCVASFCHSGHEGQGAATFAQDNDAHQQMYSPRSPAGLEAQSHLRKKMMLTNRCTHLVALHCHLSPGRQRIHTALRSSSAQACVPVLPPVTVALTAWASRRKR